MGCLQFLREHGETSMDLFSEHFKKRHLLCWHGYNYKTIVAKLLLMLV
jgi:hypothetical protein